MDTADDRLRSVVLVGVTLAVLAVGGWWWRAAAPAPTAGSAGPPTAASSVSTDLDRVVASGALDERVTMRVDPQTGDIISFQRRPSLIDPTTGALTGIDSDEGVLSSGSDLPSFHQTIWREDRELAPGQGLTRQASDDGSRYLLQYRCTRPGAMAVTGTGAEIAGPPRIDCDGSVASAEVLPGGGPFRVSLSAVGDQPIDVEVQLVALPPR
ncbi:hypothetical protein F8271_08885 [Micromonospora sp. ALFpr18c]|uniref:hypothetical protein n=1 Tax=unclassified Micromonospora TaxID=2617518 RepID=UPI00124B9201|nr:hypothetical protein [Micromonospora sp. ALFpr18c]KAB1944595.1 hypothetical protein F8271_08885 [Micromonospora sp. ALFpr18c]